MPDQSFPLLPPRFAPFSRSTPSELQGWRVGIQSRGFFVYLRVPIRQRELGRRNRGREIAAGHEGRARPTLLILQIFPRQGVLCVIARAPQGNQGYGPWLAGALSQGGPRTRTFRRDPQVPHPPESDGRLGFRAALVSSSRAASTIWCVHPLQLFMPSRVQVVIASVQRHCSPPAPVSRAGNRFAKPGCAIGPSCSSLFGLSGIIIKRPRWHDVTPPPSRSPILDCGLPVPTLGAAAFLAQSQSSCPLQNDLSRLRQSRARN